MRRVRVLALTAVLAALVCGPAAAQQTVEWTVMVYLDSDTPSGFTDLSNAAVEAFNGLEQVGSTANVNLVVQWDRSSHADLLNTAFAGDTTQSWSTCRRYLVTKDPLQSTGTPNGLTAATGLKIASSPLMDLGEVDMSDPNTLTSFVSWCQGRFPARHYALSLWDTGRGWQPRHRSLLFDGATPSAPGGGVTNFMSNATLRTALQTIQTGNANKPLDVLVLDAGGMANLEVVYQCRDCVNYVVAPWLERPVGGFPYHLWLGKLIATTPTTTTGIETWLQGCATDFMSAYAVGTTMLGGAQSVALGVYRMSQIEVVKKAADTLAKALLTNLPNYAAPLVRVLSEVQAGRPTDYTLNYVDLVHFAAMVQKEVTDTTITTPASSVAPAVTAALVNITANGQQQTVVGDVDLRNFNGLGIYFPQNAVNFDPAYSTATDFTVNTQWDELVQGLLTLNSDQTPPTITINSPLAGATIIENPPTIVATIVDTNTGGRVNSGSIVLVLDGTTIATNAYTFDANSGLLSYTIPAALSVTSHTFSITAKDLSGNAATATGNFRIAVPTLAVGIQTFSLPRILSGIGQEAPLFGADNFSLVRWVPSLFGTSKYRTYPDTFASFQPPDAAATLAKPIVTGAPAGLGYWLRVRQSKPLPSLPGSTVAASEYAIQLYKNPDGGDGWNLIGNPYDVSAVGLASTQVQLSDGRRITFGQAITQGYTTGVLFTYVPNTANPNAAGRYDFQDAGSGQLTRLQAHWLKVSRDVTLIVTSGARQAQPATPPTGRSVPVGGWTLNLKADAGEAGWDQAILGAGRAVQDGYDPRWDVAAPPGLPGAVEVRSVHSDWGEANGRYLRDLRSVAGDQAWQVEVTAPDGPVTLSWPSLRALPADVELTLTDLTTGQSQRLRTTSSYRFAHSGGTRALRVVAGRRAGSGLNLGDVTVTTGRGSGLVVGFTLSRAADVMVRVKGLGGRPLQQVAAPQQAAGRGVLGWDGRDANGQPVPNGIYLLEVIATSDDGATVRQVRTVRVVR